MKIYDIIFRIAAFCIYFCGISMGIVAITRSIYFRHQKDGVHFDYFSPLKKWEKQLMAGGAICFILFILLAFLGIYLRDKP